jgi:hypothetical protein
MKACYIKRSGLFFFPTGGKSSAPVASSAPEPTTLATHRQIAKEPPLISRLSLREYQYHVQKPIQTKQACIRPACDNFPDDCIGTDASPTTLTS